MTNQYKPNTIKTLVSELVQEKNGNGFTGLTWKEQDEIINLLKKAVKIIDDNVAEREGDA